MTENIKTSYSAAGEVPLKVVLNDNIMNSIRNGGMIPMTHVQLIPTNQCNLNCPFCSCGDRDKNLELSLSEIYDVMVDAKACGCEAVTITGGGEPLLHPEINDIIHILKGMNIDVGLVTNGLLLDNLNADTMKEVTWIRISSGDHRDFTYDYAKYLYRNVKRGPTVDWAFSHVVSDKPNMDTICNLVDFANHNKFTHVRLVSDLLNLPKEKTWNPDLPLPPMERIRDKLFEMGVDDSRVNYQDRQEYTPGRKECLISLLKPVIGADGKIYACCGIQYAFPEVHKDLVRPMGEMRNLKRIYLQQENFDGSQCIKCYYDNYNSLLGALKSDIKHRRFV
jgi:molybdenum cofactor biosynthesis enzyme MoaA